jgi:hypothetical protein
MNSNGLIKFRFYWMALIVALASLVPALGGGFQLEVQAPSSNDQEVKGAVVLVRTYGCNTPADANVRATAEGIVNGQRQSVPLKLTQTSKGVYAINKQWASNGVWLLTITGQYNGITSSALVELGDNGKVRVAKDNRAGAKLVQRKFSSQEIESILHNLANKAL